MARDLVRTNRAASHDPAGECRQRHTPSAALAVGIAVWAFQPDADFRRRIGRRLESRQGAGTAFGSDLAGWRTAPDGRRFQSRWPDLLLHPAQLQSPI